MRSSRSTHARSPPPPQRRRHRRRHRHCRHRRHRHRHHRCRPLRRRPASSTSRRFRHRGTKVWAARSTSRCAPASAAERQYRQWLFQALDKLCGHKHVDTPRLGVDRPAATGWASTAAKATCSSASTSLVTMRPVRCPPFLRGPFLGISPPGRCLETVSPDCLHCRSFPFLKRSRPSVIIAIWFVPTASRSLSVPHQTRETVLPAGSATDRVKLPPSVINVSICEHGKK